MGERVVGLDIGTSALRAVEIVLDEGAVPVLEAFAQVGLTPGAVVDGEVRDAGQVTKALRRLWRKGGFKTARVHMGVAGPRAITRDLQLPPLPPEELDDAVLLQAEDIVPFPVDRCAIASTVVSRTTDADGVALLGVLVAAVHRELVDGIVAAAESAGLEPLSVDLDPAALCRAVVVPEATASGAPDAIVSIGAGLTIVAVHRDGILQFVRTLALGGDSATRALSSALDLPRDDAELAKRRLAETGTHDPIALAAIAGAVDELAREIHSSLRYYSAATGHVAPARVLVTGAGARTLGMMDALRERVDVPVLDAQPLATVDLRRIGLSAAEAAAITPVVAVPLGLALGGAGGSRFDLMPREIRVRRAERRVRRVLAVAAALVVLVLGGVSAWRVLAVRSAQRQVRALTSAVRTINTVELPRYDKAVRLERDVTALDGQLKPLVAHEVDWLVVLNQLGEYLPPTAVLDGLSLSAAAPTGAGPGTGPAGAKGTSSSGIVGAGSTTVYTTGTLTGVTVFGHAMARSAALSDVALSGSVSKTSSSTLSSSWSVSFPVEFSITNAAHSQRLSLFQKSAT